MRRWLANLGLLVASLGVLATAGELLLRTLPRPRQAEVRSDGEAKYRFNPFRPDGLLSYSLRPNWESVHETDEFSVTVRTNDLGLRGSPAARAKPSGTHRTLVVGDSFAFGWGVEDDESFAAVLARELDPTSRRVEVLNAGVPGWSADQYYVYLNARGLDLEPDLVLLAVHDNDLKDLTWNRLTLDEERLPVRVESTLRMIDQWGRMRYVNEGRIVPPVLRFPGKTWLADRSLLYHWLRFRIAKLWVGVALRRQSAARSDEAGPPPQGPIEGLPPGEILRGLQTGKDFQLRYHRYLVAAIERDCRARGVALRRMVIARRGAPDPGDAESRMHAACARSPDCFDTAGLFPPGREEGIFYAQDRHWTPRGHRLAGEALARWLARDPELRLAH